MGKKKKRTEKTHIICILDRSGSMLSIIDDSIGGFNNFLKTQKDLPDEATITIVLFDHEYEIIYDNVDIKKAKELTTKEWFPRGTTALYDAIGKTINTEKQNIVKPSKVLVCIVTDGQENASKEFKLDDIKTMIANCEKDNWNFMYLAANQDAFSVGTSFGVSGNNTYTYTANSRGILNLSSTLSDAATQYRSMSTLDADFNKMSKTLINKSEE
jgi:uncharacterized protein YegL